jgi:hypothetical protein
MFAGVMGLGGVGRGRLSRVGGNMGWAMGATGRLGAWKRRRDAHVCFKISDL